MSALLRRENLMASPEPISPNPSYLSVRPVVSITPSGDSTARVRKKSAPTTPTSASVIQDLQRPTSMPDMKDQMVQTREGAAEGEATIKAQKPTS